MYQADKAISSCSETNKHTPEKNCQLGKKLDCRHPLISLDVQMRCLHS